MAVVFKRINAPGWRWRKSRGAEWVDAFAHATVEGHTVTVTPKNGWRCSCPDPDCSHPDAMAALIHPHTLALLEGERVIPNKEKTS